MDFRSEEGEDSTEPGSPEADRPVGPAGRRTAARPGFARKALIAAVVAVGVYALARLAWVVVDTLLLLYLAVILGIGLRGLADLVSEKTRLPVGAALAAVVLLLLGAPVGGGLLLAPQLQDQVDEAQQHLPQLRDQVESWFNRVDQQFQSILGSSPEPRSGARQGSSQEAPPGAGPQQRPESTEAGGGPADNPAAGASPGGTSPGQATDRQASGADQVVTELSKQRSSQIVQWLGNFVGGVGFALGGFLLVIVVGIYLAASPGPYERGVLALVPERYVPRAKEVLNRLTHRHRAWIVGQLAAMLLVGVATGVGLALLGIPMALLLGILAGLMDFIPNFGPGLAAIPAVLLAAGQGKVLPVLALYGAVQVVEGWLVRPLIERRAVDTPPALLLGTQVVLAGAIGLSGLLLAPALVMLVRTLIAELYVKDMLGKELQEEDENGDSSNRATRSDGSS
jgi:predicted PurR-regulated permease PerM